MQKGFGLIGILIVVGIIAILGVGALKMNFLDRNPFVPNTEEKSAIEMAEQMKNVMEEKNTETVAPVDTTQDETTDWKTYRNEEYGFEFRYPSQISHITYNYERPVEGSACFVESYFYDAGIVDETKNTYKTTPTDSMTYLSLCVVNSSMLTKGNNPPPTLKDFPEVRYSLSIAPSFKETKVGNLNALELVNYPEYKNILIVQLPSGIIVEFTNVKVLRDVNVIAGVKDSFRSTQ